MEGKVVYEGKSKNGTDFIIRYPTMDDAQALTDYINTLSDEQTFITYQGEKESLEGETKWLKDQLDGIEKGTIVYLVAETEGKIIGSSGINLQKRTSSHEGIFGITIAKGFRREGVGHILMQTILDESKKRLSDLKIITLGVFGNNQFAIEMYQKFGFKEYGRLPKGLKYKGEFIDHIYMYKEV